MKNKFRDQEVQVTLFLPEGSILYADENTGRFHMNSSYYNDILVSGQEEHYLEIRENEAFCGDCPEDTWMEEDEGDSDDNSWEEQEQSQDTDFSDDFDNTPARGEVDSTATRQQNAPAVQQDSTIINP